MKQTFTLVALLFLGLAASAQSSNLKSVQGLKLGLDSIENNYWNSHTELWDTTKYHYDYDASGQMTLYYNEYIDNSTGELIGEDRYEYSYRSDGSMDEYLYLQWDEDISDWESDTREVYSYADNGNQSGYMQYQWDNSGELWVREDSVVNTYNEEGLLTTYSSYEWKTDQWIIRYYSEYSYNAEGLLSEQISRMWYEDDQEWKNNIRYVMTWNGQGQLLTKTRYDQDVYEGPWLLEYVQELTYNAENLRTISSSSNWETDHWEIYRTDTVDYNGSGLPIENRGYYLDEGNMRPDYTHVYSFDASANLIEFIVSNWDRNLLTLVQYGKYNYSYDPGYDRSDLLLPTGDSEWDVDLNLDYTNNMPLAYQAYRWENESWEDARELSYFYSEWNVQGVGVEENKMLLARLYPNPVSEFLQVELEEGSSEATLMLYELTGRQVLRHQLQSSGLVSMSNLPQGVYLYSLTVDGKTQSGKLVKR